jgi:hypothetical protein
VKTSLAKIVSKLDKNRKADVQSDIPEVTDQDEKDLSVSVSGPHPIETLDEDEDYKATKEVSTEEAKDILKETSTQLETLVDNLMEINTEKQYSKLIQLLRNAARLSDTLSQSEDLLK